MERLNHEFVSPHESQARYDFGGNASRANAYDVYAAAETMPDVISGDVSPKFVASIGERDCRATGQPFDERAAPLQVEVSGETSSDVTRVNAPTLLHEGDDFQESSHVAENDHKSSVERLQHFLSIHSSPSIPPIMHTARTLRSFYRSAKCRCQLHSLRSAEFSALISLFGSLSLSTSRYPYRSIHGHPYVSHMTSSFRSHWAFVLELANDKHRLNHALSYSDRYWLMRARLAELQTAPGDTSATNVTLSERSLHLARRHYDRIHYSSAKIDLHVPYLEALLSHLTPEHISEAVHRLCELLARLDFVQPRLLALLFQAVLRPDHELPPSLKLELLLALRQRLSKVSDTQAGTLQYAYPHSSHRGPPDFVESVIRSQSQSLTVINVGHLANCLKDALFSRRTWFSSSAPLHRGLSEWALSLVQAVFLSDSGDGAIVDSCWSCLVLLAIVNNPHGNKQGYKAITWHRGFYRPAVADWQTICILASLENIFHSVSREPSLPFTDDVQRGFGRILEALWSNWSVLVVPESLRPTFVQRVICASFLRLAGRMGNRNMFNACNHFCSTFKLSSASDSGIMSTIGIRSFAQEQLIASLSCGSSVEVALASTKEALGSRQMFSAVVSEAVSHYSCVNVHIACEVLGTARRVGIAVSSDSVTRLTIALATQGLGEVALRQMENAHLTSQQHMQIMGPLMLLLGRHGRRYSAQFVAGVTEAMDKLFSFQTPPISLRRRLEKALLVMPRFGQASKALAILTTIVNVQPSYFEAYFFRALMNVMLDHRQFGLAKHVFELHNKLYPLDPSLSTRSFVLRCFRGGAGVLASRVVRAAGQPMRHSTAISLVRMVRFRWRTPAPSSTLRIPALLTRHSMYSRPLARYVLHLLVRSGRLRAAKKLYGQLQEHQSRVTQTALGNSILHGSILRRSRRNARKMRKALDTLDEMVKKFGFIPDRVTVNILLKVLMLWTKQVDSKKLRTLFDHMLRSGYPSGGVPFQNMSPVPFGSAVTTPVTFEIPKITSGISFTRHVRPLYKMFIKALYIRGDVFAARTVLRILKAVEVEMIEATEERERARRAGRRTLRPFAKK
ncbi:hypothetical protein AcW1_008301 [Taiwanofungus camphoratus]|nr:hypothetical protein AcW1_008301 [Antrodia cinnamomea]